VAGATGSCKVRTPLGKPNWGKTEQRKSKQSNAMQSQSKPKQSKVMQSQRKQIIVTWVFLPGQCNTKQTNAEERKSKAKQIKQRLTKNTQESKPPQHVTSYRVSEKEANRRRNYMCGHAGFIAKLILSHCLQHVHNARHARIHAMSNYIVYNMSIIT
jgi:hypothetical protein